MKRESLAVLAAVLLAAILPGCVVFTTGGEREPTTNPPDSQPPATRPSPGGGSSHVTGSGNVEVEERQVAGFDRLRVGGAADVFIEHAAEESLTVEAEDNLLPLLISEVQDGQLRLGVRPNSSISATRPIIFRLTVRDLREVEASGAGRIDASGFDNSELRVDMSGAVTASFSGRAENQEIAISGSGRFDGRELLGRRVTVNGSGTSEVVVNASDHLFADVSGTVTVRYVGSPQVDRRTSGVATVDPLS